MCAGLFCCCQHSRASSGCQIFLYCRWRALPMELECWEASFQSNFKNGWKNTRRGNILIFLHSFTARVTQFSWAIMILLSSLPTSPSLEWLEKLQRAFLEPSHLVDAFIYNQNASTNLPSGTSSWMMALSLRRNTKTCTRQSWVTLRNFDDIVTIRLQGKTTVTI